MTDPTTPSAVAEHEAINAMLEVYFHGARTGRSEDLRAAFHPDATIFGYVGPDLFAGPIAAFYEWHDENGPAASLRAAITAVDLADSIATARVELEDWTGHRFTDLFTLLKVDGEWKIMNKVFHMHA